MLSRANIREPNSRDVENALEAAPFIGLPQDEEELLAIVKLLIGALLADGDDEAPN